MKVDQHNEEERDRTLLLLLLKCFIFSLSVMEKLYYMILWNALLI